MEHSDFLNTSLRGRAPWITLLQERSEVRVEEGNTVKGRYHPDVPIWPHNYDRTGVLVDAVLRVSATSGPAVHVFVVEENSAEGNTNTRSTLCTEAKRRLGARLT